jgi:hypothetical protein
VEPFELKPLTEAGIPGAIDKAKQYRLLNEPGVAESICRDVLLIDAQNAEARIVLLLSLTDMFARGIAERFDEALALARALPDEYERAYYAGIVFERRAKAHHRSTSPAAGQVAYEWFRRAMGAFAEAEQLRPEGDDSAILRWNSCVRRLRAHPDLHADVDDRGIAPQLGE